MLPIGAKYRHSAAFRTTRLHGVLCVTIFPWLPFRGRVGRRTPSTGKSGTWGFRGCPSQWFSPFFLILSFSRVEPLLGGGSSVLHVPHVLLLPCVCPACRARSGHLAFGSTCGFGVGFCVLRVLRVLQCARAGAGNTEGGGHP